MKGLLVLMVLLRTGDMGGQGPGSGAARAVVKAEDFPGADLGQKIVRAQQTLGRAGGTVRVGEAGTVERAFTLAAGNDLMLAAPVRLSAVVTLAGANRVSCAGSGPVQVAVGHGFFSSGDGIEIDHCAGQGDGTRAASLLRTEGASHVHLHDNVLRSLGVVHAVGGAELKVDGNQVSWPALSQGYGVVWSETNDVAVDHNRFRNVEYAVEFFNADADGNHGGPTSRAGVLRHGGRYQITNNVCSHAKACFWGSVGHDVVMRGNDASECTDVCYDLEGSVDARVEDNSGAEAVHGVGATFFFSDHVAFVRNRFGSSRGAPLIMVHNDSQMPARNQFLEVRGNSLRCSSVCAGVTGDPAAEVTIEGNQLQNATIALTSFGGNTLIRNNHLVFTVTGGTAFAAIAGPFLLNGAKLEMAGNVVEGPRQPDGSACLSDRTGDMNSNVTIRVTGNQCRGGFPIDLKTVNEGTNPGTGVTTQVSGNWWGQNRVEHLHATGNRDSYQETGQYTRMGGVWMQQ